MTAHALRPSDRLSTRDLWWLVPVAVLGTLVTRIGMHRTPQRVDDEGTYVAQAFAVTEYGELAHYTYWYDHPPLGWLQMSGWLWLTQGFERMETAVLAGREFMVLVHLVSVVLLWLLARRLLRSPAAATAAAALFSISPLALQFHRTVYLDNIAVMWVLAACLLATVRHHQLLAHAAAGLCLGVAVLTKETFLLLAVPVVWELARRAHEQTRRYTLTIAAGSLVLAGLGYLLYAVLKGELLPGKGVSLLDAIHFQLLGRTGSGSLLDPSSQAHDTVTMWLEIDPMLVLLALPAAVGALWHKPLRPYAATYLLLTLLLFREGYLPIPYVVAMLPFAALVLGGVVVIAVRWLLERNVGAALAATTAVTAATVAVVAPPWAGGLQRAVAGDSDRPMREAQAFIEQEVPRHHRLLVDDALWVDLVQAGFPRDHVVWFYKPDTDPEVAETAPKGWRNYDWVMVTEAVRQMASQYPTVKDAIAHSEPVATFGEGRETVELRRITDRKETRDTPQDRTRDPRRPADDGTAGGGGDEG